MKRIFAVFLLTVLLCAIFTGCAKTETPSEDSAQSNGETKSSPSDSTSSGLQGDSDTMYIIIGEHTLPVKMADNSSASALLELLKQGDITVDAHDYGNFEKVGPLGTQLPVNNEQITTEPGDVILSEGNLLVIYYTTNTWNFTRLGKVRNMTAEALRQALGKGSVVLTLSADETD